MTKVSVADLTGNSPNSSYNYSESALKAGA